MSTLTTRRPSDPTSDDQWIYTVWRRQIHWPLLMAAIALSVLALTMTTVGYALDLLPWPIAAVALGTLAALWHCYIRRPLSITTAHRSIATTGTDNRPGSEQLPIELGPIRAELVATTPAGCRPPARQLPARTALPALTTTSSTATALEANR